MKFFCFKYSFGFGYAFILTHTKKWPSKMFHFPRFVFDVTKKKAIHEIARKFENYLSS